MFKSRNNQQYRKERKEIYSMTIEPSKVNRLMKNTGQTNFSQTMRMVIQFYEENFDKKNK